MVSGDFFRGLAQLLEVLLKAISQFRESADQRRRKEVVRTILAVCIVVDEVVLNGRGLLRLAGTDPVSRVTEMEVEQRRKYASECYRALALQMNRLERLSDLIESVPVIGILDVGLKNELDTIVGTKQEGLMAIAAPIGFYLRLGALPEQKDIAQYGEELACIRYQAGLLALLFDSSASLASETIDVPSAIANLDALAVAGERLKNLTTELFSKEEIISLAKEAGELARK